MDWTMFSVVAACGHTNWVPEWEAGAVWERMSREIMEAKTCFCSRPPSLLRVCAYKEGRPIPCQSILGACCQPVGDLLDAVSEIISRATQQVAVSWRRAGAGDRTIEPSHPRWSHSQWQQGQSQPTQGWGRLQSIVKEHKILKINH